MFRVCDLVIVCKSTISELISRFRAAGGNREGRKELKRKGLNEFGIRKSKERGLELARNNEKKSQKKGA